MKKKSKSVGVPVRSNTISKLENLENLSKVQPKKNETKGNYVYNKDWKALKMMIFSESILINIQQIWNIYFVEGVFCLYIIAYYARNSWFSSVPEILHLRGSSL